MEPTNSETIEAVNRFKKTIIAHPTFDAVLQNILRNIRMPSDRRLIPVIGPTGVGKTAIMATVIREVIEGCKNELKADVSIQPLVNITIDSQKSVTAAMKDMFSKILLGLDGLPTFRTNPSICKTGADFHQARKKETENDLRNATFSLIKERKPKVILIDEGQHLTKAKTGGEAAFQFDALKRIADECGVPIILIGHYDLYDFITGDAQLSRRSNCLHFAPYDWGKPKDQKAFITTVKSFGAYFQDQQISLDVSTPEYFFELSLGCVGTLKTMLAEAYTEALEQRLNTITIEMVKAHASTFRSRNKMLSDITTGRVLFSTTQEDQLKYRALLGLPANDTGSVIPAPAKPATRKIPVGVQKAKRSPVGIPRELVPC
jgi:hypothetical protein